MIEAINERGHIMHGWRQGYIVVVAGKDVYQTLSKADANKKADQYKGLGYGPVHIMQGPIMVSAQEMDYLLEVN